MRTLLIALGLAWLAAGCGQKETPAFDASTLLGAAPAANPPAQGGTFVWGRSSDSVKLDPATVSDGESVMVITNVFDTLVGFAPGALEIVPSLATEWTTSADGLVWEFKLRTGVKFHDGTPLDADAVVFTYERQMDENHPARRADDEFGTFLSYTGSALDRVEAVDAHTVRFTLKRAYAPLLYTLALYCNGIVSPTAFRSEGKDENGRYNYDFARKPVGSGPFRFESWRSDVEIVLTANEEYWDGRPHIDKLVFRPIENAQARLKELEAGGIHGMDNPELIDLPSIHADGELRIVSRPGINVCYLAMHTQKPPLDDVRVRQAIAYAVDKRRILAVAYNNMAETAVTMCPKTLWGHLDRVDRKVDLKRARALLAEAGHGDGFKTTLWYSAKQRTYLPNPGDTAIQIQQDLKEIGIEVELKKLDWSAYLTAIRNASHDMCLIGWMADIGDPDGFLYVLLDKENARLGSADNFSWYQGERVHKLLREAQTTLDQKKRIDLYREVQEVVFDEVPCLPLATVRDFRVLRPEVRGYTIYPAGGEYFRHVSFAR